MSGVRPRPSEQKPTAAWRRRIKHLRVTVIHHEFPYPPIHGGKADVWSRLVGLRRLGVQIQLVCWHERSQPTTTDLGIVQEITPNLICLTPGSRWSALSELRYPP